MKKRIFSILIGLILTFSLTACTGNTPASTSSVDAPPASSTDVDPDLSASLIKQSEVLTEDIVGGAFDNTIEHFDANLKSQLGKDKLSEAWSVITKSSGAYEKIHSSTASKKDSNTIIEVLVKYEKGAIKLTYSYNVNGEIDGIWIAPTDISEAQSSDVFKETTITIGKNPFTLNGMLTQPVNGTAAKAVVILVHGSGQSDLNETVGENKPFQDIAHGLAAQGISSIRYNKRYFQHADKVTADMTIEQEVLDDVSYAIDFAQSNDSLKDCKIYIAGHSMGGMLAPKITLDNKEVAGFISLAGSPRQLIDIIYDQNKASVNSMTDKSQEEKDALIASVDEQIKLVKELNSDSPESAPMGIPSSYWLSLNAIDTPTIVKQLDSPMLFLQGGADFQVYADVDYVQWQALLKDNSKAEFKLYEELNHLFFKTKGKSDIAEYDGENHVEQVVIDDMANWIKSQ